MPYLIVILLTLINFPVNAQAIQEDRQAARILAYYGIGHEASPATSVTTEQFNAHINQLAHGHSQGDYNVIALPDVIEAYRQNTPLPDNAVVITFDGSEKSVLTHAAPLLKKHQFPFTVFLAPKRIRDNNPRFLNRKDIKRLRKNQLVSFGIHPDKYDAPTHHDINEFDELSSIRASLNNSVAFYRDLFGTQPKYLAFRHGVYSEMQLRAIENYDFDAILGQHSGVAYHNPTGSILPRFVMTENYADQNRFNMVTKALPLPVDEVHPKPSVLKYKNPAIGFTSISNATLDKLSCYASGQAKPRLERLNDRIEIRLNEEISTSRFRVNCTLPVKGKKTEEIKWRWHGFLFERLY